MLFHCVRIYRLRPGTTGRVVNLARRFLLPALEGQAGFRHYHLLTTADDRLVSDSVWETEAQAAFADLLESDWVRAHISDDLDGLPDLLIGVDKIDTGQLP